MRFGDVGRLEGNKLPCHIRPNPFVSVNDITLSQQVMAEIQYLKQNAIQQYLLGISEPRQPLALLKRESFDTVTVILI